jgi:hypothetical protein
MVPTELNISHRFRTMEGTDVAYITLYSRFSAIDRVFVLPI